MYSGNSTASQVTPVRQDGSRQPQVNLPSLSQLLAAKGTDT